MEKLNSKLNKYSKKNLDVLLISDFKKEQKDEDFNKLVSKIDFPIEILSKYTSILKECSKEYSNCSKCKCLDMCKNKITGYAYLPIKKENALSFGYRACKYQKKYLDTCHFEQNVYVCDLPSEIKKASLKNIYLDDNKRYKVIKWIKNFIKNYEKDKHLKGLYLTGSFGAGKTYILSALFNEFAKKNVKSAIIFWPEYLNDLKASFNGNKDSFKNKFNYIKNVPLLLIDDIGAENSTSWSRDDILSPILQHRMDEKLPTFFTSNLDLKALENHFSFTKASLDTVKSRRIIERIKQLTDNLDLISENLRK